MADYVTSLSTSFWKIPPESVPAMLDCIIASSSTSLSASSLLSLLVDAFPSLTQDMTHGNDKLDSKQCNYIASFVAALCHLLKKSGSDHAALKHFIWRVLIPLMKSMHYYEHEILNKAVHSFLNVVVETNSWRIVEETMTPFFLRLAGLSMGMVQSEELTVYRWSKQITGGDDVQLTQVGMNEDTKLNEAGSFPLRVSCHILNTILDAALQSISSVESTCKSVLANGSSVNTFTGNMVWDICHMTVQMLSQGLEHRACAITFLLPAVLKAFASDRTFVISSQGQKFTLSRNNFFIRIWKCCKSLFPLGPLERRDAYTALSLYLPFLYKNDGCEDSAAREETFDVRAENEFWNEMKRGLVDKEGAVRKQSLHILKTSMQISGDSQPSAGSETLSCGPSSVSDGMTKKGRWASKEAKSLGVGKICNSNDSRLNGQQKWGAFFLLYEMLEEYGTHLVEAAWSYQINLLLHISFQSGNPVNHIHGQMETLEEIFDWLAILWQRGFCHDNPQVRCLIMQSFLGIEWKNYGNCAKLVPEDFLLGPFLQGLNDPVHHKEFGIKGVYTSRTIEGAGKFVQQYTSGLRTRELIAFLSNLASRAKTYSFGRVGLMSLAQCIASAACGVQTSYKPEVELHDEVSAPGTTYSFKAELLDVFRFIIESSKQHFNPNYRLKVSGKVLDAAASVMSTIDVPLELLLHFISALPQDFTGYGGSLRVRVQEWLWTSDEKHSSSTDAQLLKSLNNFPRTFLRHGHLVDDVVTYDDEDLGMWELEAKRWARVLFLVIREEHQFDPLLTFIQNHGSDICEHNSNMGSHVKFLILAMSVVQELQEMKERTVDHDVKERKESSLLFFGITNHPGCIEPSKIVEKFAKSFTMILDALVSFANWSCSVFWSSMVHGDANLPSSVRGKLGGPSQRRLSSSATTVVLQGITSVKALGSISSWCAQFGREVQLDSALNFLFQLSLKIIPCSTCNSEAEAEIFLAAYEALTYVLKTLVSHSSLDLGLLKENWKRLPLEAPDSPLLDSFVRTFFQHTNYLITLGNLARSRRAVLMGWKWICLEYLLSIPKNALQRGIDIQRWGFFFSDGMVRWIFSDLVDSLENAGEGSVLPMLRSVRLILELFASGRMGSVVSSCDGINVQAVRMSLLLCNSDAEADIAFLVAISQSGELRSMMWHLVQSSWILHSSCNKRRVAPIAALLTSVLHYSVFNDEAMHEIDSAPGPLKWFADKILEEGTKSPRTIRLAALHFTGLWLSNPSTIKYYMKELKLLTLYGSVAFDEDFEGEVTDNHDARSEVSLMAKSSDPELTQEFINTELYARVSVAVMFNKLADLADTVGSKDENENSLASLQCGKLFLLELLDFVVNDRDLAKELYKKYSAIHRRKTRAWQMICILSRFVDKDTVQKVTCNLHMALYRNNFPAVRQYLETFAIFVYLKFPSLVREQLVLLLRDYDMRTQALSSYVFIAANVILHSTEAVQSRHLDELLPPIVPLLTSHHHSLRAFSQLLVYQVLCKLLPTLDSGTCATMPLETKCFVELKSYLKENSDCARLRTSMEHYLDDFNPESSISPAGIFSNRVEDVEFECAPTSLLERVLDFLNDVRKDLRSSMAKDAATLKNEQLQIDEDRKSIDISSNPREKEMSALPPTDLSLDFQKKITLSSTPDADAGFLRNEQTYKSLLVDEKDGRLLDQVLHARSVAILEQREGRQHIILVASLLDRIPNLAGLARTCEVFKAASLAIADANILHDKQFQLISVTAEKWVPIIEVPASNVKVFLEKKKQEGFSILGLEQTANSLPLDQYAFPKKTVLVLGREKEGIPVELIHILDACIEIPQLGVVRSLNVHVSGAIALWEYTRQQRSQ